MNKYRVYTYDPSEDGFTFRGDFVDITLAYAYYQGTNNDHISVMVKGYLYDANRNPIV